MDLNTRITRKTFLNTISVLGLGAFVFVWSRMIRNQEGLTKPGIYRHKADIAEGVSFFDNYYIYRKGRVVLAFSTRCTHAGCRIDRVEGNSLFCPCHGSRFDASNGKPLKGPAFKNLTALGCHLDTKNNEWIIRI